MIPIRCCKNCTDKRHVGCHDSCEEYLNEKAKNDVIRKTYHEGKDMDSYFAKRSIQIKKRAKIE